MVLVLKLHFQICLRLSLPRIRSSHVIAGFSFAHLGITQCGANTSLIFLSPSRKRSRVSLAVYGASSSE